MPSAEALVVPAFSANITRQDSRNSWMLRSTGSVVVTSAMMTLFCRHPASRGQSRQGWRMGQDTKTTVTFNPKGLVVTGVFLGVIGLALALAQDIEVAAGAGAAASLLAYLFVDVVFSFNPSSVRRRRDA